MNAINDAKTDIIPHNPSIIIGHSRPIITRIRKITQQIKGTIIQTIPHNRSIIRIKKIAQHIIATIIQLIPIHRIIIRSKRMPIHRQR